MERVEGRVMNNVFDSVSLTGDIVKELLWDRRVWDGWDTLIQ